MTKRVEPRDVSSVLDNHLRRIRALEALDPFTFTQTLGAWALVGTDISSPFTVTTSAPVAWESFTTSDNSVFFTETNSPGDTELHCIQHGAMFVWGVVDMDPTGISTPPNVYVTIGAASDVAPGFSGITSRIAWFDDTGGISGQWRLTMFSSFSWAPLPQLNSRLTMLIDEFEAGSITIDLAVMFATIMPTTNDVITVF